jgi:hypothetical protein
MSKYSHSIKLFKTVSRDAGCRVKEKEKEYRDSVVRFGENKPIDLHLFIHMFNSEAFIN